MSDRNRVELRKRRLPCCLPRAGVKNLEPFQPLVIVMDYPLLRKHKEKLILTVYLLRGVNK